MIGQPIADLEKVTEVPSGSLYPVTMGDGSGTKAVTQETLTKEVGKGLKVGDLAELQTENKNNLVAAINEAAQSGGGGSAVDILDTKEEIEANTESGKAAGALAVQEMFGALNDNLGGYSFGETADGKPGFRKPGADTVTPFTNNAGLTKMDFTLDYGSIQKPYIYSPATIKIHNNKDSRTYIIIKDMSGNVITRVQPDNDYEYEFTENTGYPTYFTMSTEGLTSGNISIANP